MAMESKVRHDWYETTSDVCVNILVKAEMRQSCSVTFEPKRVLVSIPLTTGSEYSLNLNLAEEIVPDNCSYKELKSKVEIKMRKKVGNVWSSLEGKEEPLVKQKTVTDTSEGASSYPSSSHYTRNWDKLVGDIKKDEEKEKPEGDAALNKLFQQIYTGGNDEVRKAMNKSFVESGGTVLSTNWDEVGNKKVDMKAPDGMEFKKYEQ